MRIASAEEMRLTDHAAINDRKIDSLLLMERAAEGITAEALKLLPNPHKASAVTFSGPGNNGGDGIAAARLLTDAGVSVTAFLVGKREKMTEDSRAMEQRLNRTGCALLDYDPEDAGQAAVIENADLFIDALFGIGLNSDIRGNALSAIERMNASSAPVVAADIASGVEADTGRILGTAVNAAVTVTFTCPKVGHYVGKGGVCAGRVAVHDIGIPADLVESLVQPGITAVDAELVRSFLPKRPADGHKGTFGKDYILAGSTGFTGAPILAARAAVRSGAGLVHLGVPESIYTIAAVKSDEAMPYPLPADEEGRVSGEALTKIFDKMADCDAALIGPGLGTGGDVKGIVGAILDMVNYPLILDADGLNALKGNLMPLDARKDCPTILTPHDGEFARLGGRITDGRRMDAAQDFATKHGCLLVLKGHRTLIVLPDGETFINTNGNDGMAKGGSGDILSGIILGLLGQGIHPVKAAVAAVWLHGRAGDLAAAEKGHYAMTPTDLLEKLPEAFREVTE